MAVTFIQQPDLFVSGFDPIIYLASSSQHKKILILITLAILAPGAFVVVKQIRQMASPEVSEVPIDVSDIDQYRFDLLHYE